MDAKALADLTAAQEAYKAELVDPKTGLVVTAGDAALIRFSNEADMVLGLNRPPQTEPFPRGAYRQDRYQDAQPDPVDGVRTWVDVYCGRPPGQGQDVWGYIIRSERVSSLDGMTKERMAVDMGWSGRDADWDGGGNG